MFAHINRRLGANKRIKRYFIFPHVFSDCVATQLDYPCPGCASTIRLLAKTGRVGRAGRRQHRFGLLSLSRFLSLTLYSFPCIIHFAASGMNPECPCRVKANAPATGTFHPKNAQEMKMVEEGREKTTPRAGGRRKKMRGNGVENNENKNNKQSHRVNGAASATLIRRRARAGVPEMFINMRVPYTTPPGRDNEDYLPHSHITRGAASFPRKEKC